MNVALFCVDPVTVPWIREVWRPGIVSILFNILGGRIVVGLIESLKWDVEIVLEESTFKSISLFYIHSFGKPS
jgi:hypothetical protein